MMPLCSPSYGQITHNYTLQVLSILHSSFSLLPYLDKRASTDQQALKEPFLIVLGQYLCAISPSSFDSFWDFRVYKHRHRHNYFAIVLCVHNAFDKRTQSVLIRFASTFD